VLSDEESGLNEAVLRNNPKCARMREFEYQTQLTHKPAIMAIVDFIQIAAFEALGILGNRIFYLIKDQHGGKRSYGFMSFGNRHTPMLAHRLLDMHPQDLLVKRKACLNTHGSELVGAERTEWSAFVGNGATEIMASQANMLRDVDLPSIRVDRCMEDWPMFPTESTYKLCSDLDSI
jgi:hypothetical protein